MSSRVFQSIVLQMKECTDRVIGVIDDQGTVVSCNQLTWIGEKWEGAASALNVNESAVVIYGDKTFKPLVSRGSHFDYAAFVQGSDEQAKLICSMVTVALNSAKAYYEEKHDKTAFVKSIISDNILLGDIYVRAKELHFASEAQRAVFLVRQVGSAEIAAVDVVQSLFSDNPDDFGYRRHQDPDRRGGRQRDLPHRQEHRGCPGPEPEAQDHHRHRHRGQPHPRPGPRLQRGRRGH